MSAIRDLPEVAGLDGSHASLRIPAEIDVPLTTRVRAIVDSAEFRRLSRISQLGLVSLVYPAANHTRFEHSLGVYRMALLVLRHLAHDPRFTEIVSPADAERFIVAALVHDLGHWPFCHPIEDMQLPSVPEHELLARTRRPRAEIADVLRDDWSLQPRDVVELLSGKPQDPAGRLLASMLSGPIDIDKMDYLYRDSLHAGVPYGRNFDQGRLVGSLYLDEEGEKLAITEKGKTAAEMMVFARYVMFSEVYWHHGVRCATAMLQRAFYLIHGQLDTDGLFRLCERPMIDAMEAAAAESGAAELVSGLFGPQRRLYKRLAQFSVFDEPETFARLARRPYPWLAACAQQFAHEASTALGRIVAPHEILFDAPPVQREVDFQIDVYFPKRGRYRPLGEISPVVRALGTQLDDYVKRVRIFAHPRIVGSLRRLSNLNEVLSTAIDSTDD
ncbi:MAG: HD domain-containing protein [Planctomycetota bacterium]|nr:MAG: HD domain-containing protein [Planctomycetota bacterium]